MVLGKIKSRAVNSLTFLVLFIWRAKLKFSILGFKSVLQKTCLSGRGAALGFALCILIFLHEPSLAFMKQVGTTNRNILSGLKHKHFCSFFSSLISRNFQLKGKNLGVKTFTKNPPLKAPCLYGCFSLLSFSQIIVADLGGGYICNKKQCI